MSRIFTTYHFTGEMLRSGIPITVAALDLTPHFVATPVDPKDGDGIRKLEKCPVITHKASGLSLCSTLPLESLRQAELVAVVLENLPIDWEQFTPRETHPYQELPDWVNRYVQEFRK